MSPQVSVKIEKNNFAAAAKACAAACKGPATDLVKQTIVSLAQSRSKYDTGRMRTETIVTEKGAAAMAPYSGFVNYGTRYMAGDEWFTGAVDEVRESVPALVGPSITAAVEGAA